MGHRGWEAGGGAPGEGWMVKDEEGRVFRRRAMVRSTQCQGEVEENEDKKPQDREAPACASESQTGRVIGQNIQRADHGQSLVWQAFPSPSLQQSRQAQRGKPTVQGHVVRRPTSTPPTSP